jgi:PAS domain S-box-containing protein
MINSNNNDKLAEEKLSKNEKNLQIKNHEIILSDLLKDSAQPFAVKYLDGHLGLVNKAFEKLTGYSKEELERSNWSEILTPPEFCEIENEKTEELQRTGKPVRYEKEYIRKDGTRIPIELLLHIVKNNEGMPEFYYAFITNISKYKEAELEKQSLLDEVQEERDKLVTLVNNIPDEVWFADKNKKFILANPSALKEFNLFSNDIDIEKLATNLEVYSPNGNLRPINDSPPLKALKGEIIRNMEEIVRTPSGNELRHRQVNASPVKDAKGNIIGAVSVVRDITELKLVEKQKQKLLEKEQQLSEELQASNEELQATSEELKTSNEELQSSNEELRHASGELQKQRDFLVVLNKTVKESEEKFLKAFHANPAAMTLTDEKGRYIEVNENYSLLTGYKKHELLEHTPAELNIMDKLDHQDLLQSQLKGILQNVEFEIQKKSHKKRNVVISSELIKLDNTTRFISFIYDITERKKDEESLKRQGALLDISYEAFFSWNFNGKIVFWNQGAERLYGYNSDEAIGWISHELLKTQLPHEFEEFMENLKREKTWTGELNHTTKNGKTIIVESRLQLIEDSEGKQIVIETTRDITERIQVEAELNKYRKQLEQLVEARTAQLKETYESLQESREHYLALFNSIDEGFCTVEVIFDDNNKPIDYRFLEINPAFEKQTGLIEAEGKLMRDLAPNHEDYWFEIYGKIALTGQPIRFVNQAKELNRWYDVYAFKIGTSEGREVAIIFNDITKFKETENKLKEYQHTLEKKVVTRTKELAKSNADLEHFAHVASHDLREPLRMITSFLQLLERRYNDKLDADANEFIGFAVDGAKRLDGMIKDLLAYSQVTSEEREFSPINLENILEETLMNLKVQIDENNAVITIDPLPTVNGNSKLLVQLLQNLIANAIKYRSQDTPKIHISSKKEENQYLISVKDNGIGIDSEHQNRIFTIFQRLHRVDEYEGTGIGLAIAQKIIQELGGAIWVESEIGKGSTFYFTIPK